MDWMFYLYVAVVLFCVLAVILSIRYFLDRRLEKLEEKRRMENEARPMSLIHSRETHGIWLKRIGIAD